MISRLVEVGRFVSAHLVARFTRAGTSSDSRWVNTQTNVTSQALPLSLTPQDPVPSCSAGHWTVSLLCRLFTPLYRQSSLLACFGCCQTGCLRAVLGLVQVAKASAQKPPRRELPPEAFSLQGRAMNECDSRQALCEPP